MARVLSAGPPGGPCLGKSGRPLASHPGVWLPPSILTVDYWYLYTIGYVLRILGGISPIMDSIFPIMGDLPEMWYIMLLDPPTQ